ncbi:MAG: hypothetical protein COA43_05470 [Robiginitomaculum sp.]|nr:MAG: hypothetical protein COA43_05470 [Robiginitomaculum sp.]
MIKFKKILAATFGISLLAAPAMAQMSDERANELCQIVQQKAGRQVWEHLREQADKAGCRKRWFNRNAGEFLGCASFQIGSSLESTVRGAWNRAFANLDWATWGPRSASNEFQYGEINLGFKRVFFSQADVLADTVITVVKRDANISGNVVVCEIGDVQRGFGTATVIGKEYFARNEGVSERKRIRFDNNARQRIIGIIIDTPAVDTFVNAVGIRVPVSPIPLLPSFKYKIKVRNIWPELNMKKILPGIADLHIHQVADRGFAGRVIWGEHDGPLNQALAKDEAGAGKILFRVAEKNEDGEFKKDLVGGFPYYEDWPSHELRGHHGAHMRWLGMAHEWGLNLIVVSVVNNDFLCKALKAVDNRGNIRAYDSSGRPIGRGGLRDQWVSTSWKCSDSENIERQLSAIHKLDRDYSWYSVAMNPYHAAQIIKSGKLAVVISLETDGVLGAKGNNTLGALGDWENQLDFYRMRGVTTTQLVHESDSRFCGAAPHRDDLELGQFLRNPTRYGNGSSFRRDPVTRKNIIGLTDVGKELIHAMIVRQMPIDLAHGSEKCRQEIFAEVRKIRPNGHGLYDSHTKFERLMTEIGMEREEEYMITENLMDDYKRNNVLIGLRTAAFDVNDAPRGSVKNDCPGSVLSYAQAVDFADQQGFSIAYATDFNGLIGQLGPLYGKDSCYSGPFVDPDTDDSRHMEVGSGPRGVYLETAAGAFGIPPGENADAAPPLALQIISPRIDKQNFQFDGLASIAMLPALHTQLEQLKTPGAQRLDRSADAYIRMWNRARTRESE